jgi:bifunctional UDP-N-acetylglucosamine pyrophosphorylase/glucosamine-1-phosphate N-acetyltransferase
MIKKVVISAAGRGTRMLDLSKYRPKHLIEVNGNPFLYYLLSNLKKAGLEEMIMVIGYKKEVMEEFIEKHQGEFNITVVNQFDKLGDKYGTACPIECISDLIEENFISVNGDNLYSPEDLKKMMVDDDFIYVAGLKHSEPEKYGVLIPDGEDFLEKIIEKPKEPVGDLVNIGLYKFTPDISRAVKRVNLSVRGEYELTDAISFLAQEKKVKIKEANGYWLDFGKPADIETIEKFLKEGKL